MSLVLRFSVFYIFSSFLITESTQVFLKIRIKVTDRLNLLKLASLSRKRGTSASSVSPVYSLPSTVFLFFGISCFKNVSIQVL